MLRAKEQTRITAEKAQNSYGQRLQQDPVVLMSSFTASDVVYAPAHGEYAKYAFISMREKDFYI